METRAAAAVDRADRLLPVPPLAGADEEEEDIFVN